MRIKSKSVCPKCGHELIDPRKIALPGKPGELRCPANMPFQGCGWQGKLK